VEVRFDISVIKELIDTGQVTSAIRLHSRPGQTDRRVDVDRFRRLAH